MAEPHYIRLHGPWTAGLGDELGNVHSSQTIRVPFASADWHSSLGSLELSSGSPAAWIRLSRKFKWPHSIEPGESIAIEIEADPSVEFIELNGNRIPMELGQTVPRSQSISKFLLPFNELTLPIEIRSVSASGFCLLGVRLRISGNPHGDFDD